MPILLGLIPGVNAVVALVWIMFSGWMMAIQYLDYPADNNGMSFPDMRDYLRQHRMAAFGFGILTFGLTLIPILNLFKCNLSLNLLVINLRPSSKWWKVLKTA